VEAPTVESPIRVSQMIGWHLTMPNAPVKWISGLRSWLPPDGPEEPFTIEGGGIEDGAHVEIGSSRRSTEAFVPLLVVEKDQDTFYGGVIWSGAWRIASDRFGDELSVQADFPAAMASASPGRPVEVPHAFFGVTDTSPGAESRALRQFLIVGIRKGRPFLPLVTYNTWFPHGSRIDESRTAEEISRAAGLGVELFVLDAGWYKNAGMDHQYDFTSGLGSWTVDRTRFPRGLTVLADLAHSLGLKFGIWVEPERVALSAAGQPGLAQEAWLAMQDGSYGDWQSAQICLASDAGRQWVFDRIVELLDELRPDYLKWDNNFWINCNRGDHEHGNDDGNYAHVVALYGLLGDLRSRYPNMLIENVSGGGNRMDYGMLAYTDVGWMDDRTALSAHVRHNLEGLALAFPPAYLLSFVINSEAEPFHGGDDFSHVARSRMPGVLGVTYHYHELDAELSGAMRLGIAQYKEIRDTIAQSYAILLSRQAHAGGGWDIVEDIAEDQRSAVIFAFKGPDSEGRVLVKSQGLNPEGIYQVRSLDSGNLGSLTGEQLMLDGIELVHLDGSRAHVIVLTATNF
jgi:alpha-galactosidase